MTAVLPDSVESAASSHVPEFRVWDDETNARIAALREAFVADPENTDLSSLRPVIARSWQRSLNCNVDPGLKTFDDYRDHRLDQTLIQTAAPVLENLAELAKDVGGSITLTDGDGTVGLSMGDPTVRRFMEAAGCSVGGVMSEDVIGTNGEGTAIEEGFGVFIRGAEHFAEGMNDWGCASVPILDPLRRTVRAVLSFSVPERLLRETDSRSIAMVAQAAASEIGQLMLNRLAPREQALLTAYLAEARKRGSDAIVVMNDKTTIASSGALSSLSSSDYGVLVGYARESEQLVRPIEREIAIGSGGTLWVKARPIEDAGVAVGSLLRMRPAGAAPASATVVAATARVDEFPSLVGSSPAMRRALDLAATTVRRRLPALVVGEPGTGKTLLAGDMAERLGGETHVSDCRTWVDTPAARLELGAAVAAGRNAVVLHVDELSEAATDELCDILSIDGAAGVVLTATQRTTATTDLATSLGAIDIEMPPLRDRREDIPTLATHFVRVADVGVSRLAPGLVRALTSADWVDNVEQLRTFVVSAAARCSSGELRMDDLSEEQRRLIARKPLSRLEQAELQQIREALAQAGGNRVRAATLLEIGRSTLYRKMDFYSRRGYVLLP
jgi:transcriptional regulator of acetoin/glycerol metabolism